MTKIQTSILLEETMMNRVRATAKRMRWTLTDAAELAFKLFLEEFENAKTISVLTVEKDPEPSPEMEQVSQC